MKDVHIPPERVVEKRPQPTGGPSVTFNPEYFQQAPVSQQDMDALAGMARGLPSQMGELQGHVNKEPDLDALL